MYRVKFERDGKTHFGIVSYTGPNGKRQDKEADVLVVKDAVLPRSYEVPRTELVEIPRTSDSFGRFNHETQKWEGGDEYDAFVREAHEVAEARHAELPEGVHVGKLFSIPVADGRASYVVTRVGDGTADVEWRGFNPDRYTDHWFGYGRRDVPLEDLRPYIARQDWLRTMFSG